MKSAKHRSGVADWSWQLAGLDRDLQPHAPPVANDATPFDLSVNGDTIIVYRLEPGAWSFEPNASKVLFLKSRADGSAYPHNPFSVTEQVSGNPHMIAVRFHAPDTLAGCAYAYNLGVVVKQGGKRTPVVIDPKIENGTGN